MKHLDSSKALILFFFSLRLKHLAHLVKFPKVFMLIPLDNNSLNHLLLFSCSVVSDPL